MEYYSPTSYPNIPQPPSALPLHPPHISNVGMVLGILILAFMFSTWPIFLRLNHPDRDRQQHSSSETDIEMGDMINILNNNHGFSQTGRDGISEGSMEEKLMKVVPSFVYGDDEDGVVKCRNNDECVICWEDFEDGEICRVLPACNHVFHKSCVRLWLMEKRVCPLCRLCVEI